ncbi:MAG: TonB-dependent receptor plug domain-containing protein [Winogradskyella sp.]|uniref:TonB-dependent receptor plug domain-containing protein n=1 Tax=Winogradskyella sp. TaxID=1883156 RepID=UPI0025E9FF85|nr:TonB-dependent receptor [Winogradskyella sp.]NRB59621.1 TonB-dependent receptor plug domain-containing protein [Winogradskyella sp.]
MNKYITIVFLLFCSFFCSAQEKNQNVSYTNHPVKDIIQDIEDVFPLRFSFNNSVIENKVVSYSGTLNLDVLLDIISAQASLNFEFLDNENVIIKPINEDKLSATQKLDEVLLVSEYLTSGFNQNKKDGSISLSPKKIGVLPGLIEADVLQSLQLIPGISSPTESATNLHIRGGTPDQNLVLWDGIKMYHQGHLFGMISAFNPYITERVDVYRSGVSAKYGDRISGVIDMQSSNDILYKTSIGFGSNLLTADIFVKTPIIKDKLGILISGRRALTDVFDSPTFSQIGDKVFQNTKIEESNNLQEEEELTILKDKFYFTDFNLKALWQVSNHHQITFSGLLVDNTLDYANIDEFDQSSSDKLDLTNSGFSLSSEHYLNKKWSLSSSFHYSNYESQYILNEIQLEEEDNGFNRLNTVKDIGFTLQSSHSINSNSSINLGLDYTDSDVAFNINFLEEDEQDEIQQSRIQVLSAFAEYDYSKTKFTLKPSLRFVTFSKINKTYLEPRFYADYKLSEAFTIKSSGEIKNQSVSQLVSLEFNDLGLDDNIWTLADEDEDIPVLNSKQITTGFLINHNGWKIDVEGYYKYNKGITSFTRGFNSSSIEDNYTSGTSVVYGIDILIKKRIKRFRTWLSYSLSKTDFNFSDIQSSKFSGNFDQTHVLSVSGSYKFKQLQVSLGWNIATGKPFSSPSGIDTFQNESNETENVLVYQQQNDNRLNTYHRLDASLLYDFKLGATNKVKARIGCSVLNIYNQKNELDKLFNLEQDENEQPEIVQQTLLGLGITPNLVFRISF